MKYLIALLLSVCTGTVAAAPLAGSVHGTIANAPASETVYLDANNNGVLDPGELTTPVLAGTYSFDSVPVGAYVVRQVLPPGYVQKTPKTPTGDALYGVHVTVAAGQAVEADFVDATVVTAVQPTVPLTITPAGITAKLTFTETPNPPAPCTVFFDAFSSFPSPDSFKTHKTSIVVTGPTGVVCSEPSPAVAVQCPVAGTYTVMVSIDGFPTISTFVVPAATWTTYYYDALAGSDANKGTLQTAPKKSISGLTPPANSIHLLKNGPGETYPVSSSIRFVNPNVIIGSYGPTTQLAKVQWTGPAGPGSIFITDQNESKNYTVENIFATSVGTPAKSGNGNAVLSGSAVLCNARGTNGTFLNVQFDTLNRLVYLMNGTHGALVKGCVQTVPHGVMSQVVYADGVWNAVIYGNQFVDSWVESTVRSTLPNGFQNSVICNNHLTRVEEGKAIITIRTANNLHNYGNVCTGDNTYSFDEPDIIPAGWNALVGFDTNCLAENETLSSVLQIRPGPQGCVFQGFNITVPTGPGIGIASTPGFANAVRNCTVNLLGASTATAANTAVEFYSGDASVGVSGITLNAPGIPGATLCSNPPTGVVVIGTVTK